MRNINNEKNVGWINHPNEDGYARMSRNGESFYIRSCVKAVDADYYVGIVDNHLSMNDDLKFGEKIRFTPTP